MKYTVQLANGTSYDIEVPDKPAAPPPAPEKPISPVAGDGSEGITPMDFATPLGVGVLQKIANPRTRDAALADIENFRAGAGQRLVKAARGVKQLIDPINVGLERALGSKLGAVPGQPSAAESARQTAADVAEAQRLDKPLMDTKAGTFGGVVTDLALTAVPGSKLQRALQAKLGMGRLATAGAAGLSSAGTEFVTATGDLGDKAKAAGLAGATSGLLTGGLGLAAKPFQASKDAINLYRQGVNPTLQQAAEGAPGRFIGGLAAGGQGVRDRQRLELAKAALKRVGAVVPDDVTGRNLAEAAQKVTKAEYDALLSPKQFELTPAALDDVLARAGATNAQGQMADEAQKAAGIARNIIGPNELNSVPRVVSDKELYNNYLTKFSEKARGAGDEEVARRLLDSRRALLDVRDAQLSPEELAQLRNIDVRNFDVKRLQEAVAGEAGDKPGVSLNALAKAYGKTDMAGNTTREELIGPMQRTIGKANNANASRSAAQTYSRMAAPFVAGGTAAAVGGPWAVAPIAAAYGLSALGQTAKGAKLLTGQTAKQKALTELLRSGYGAAIAPALIDMEGSYVP